MVLLLGLLAVTLTSCNTQPRKGEESRTALVQDIIRALKQYTGKGADKADAIAEELSASAVVFDESGGGFSAGEWRYDPRHRTLERPVMWLPDEHAWIVVEISTAEPGSVQIQSIREMREHLSTE